MEEDMRQYLDEMRELFSTNGWKSIVRDAEEAIEARKEKLLQANSIDEVRFIQGETAQLRILANMEMIVDTRAAAEDIQDAAEIELIG
jgi:hypothetical protein